ncbi:MAG: dTMP kinase [Gammaproteobacteria bacterium]|nr:dTMP kinase [Gammaproteobacteria bacterium]
MKSGRFITLEGIEGAGKSTIAAVLMHTLNKQGIKTCITREPGGTPLAERLRDLLLERGKESLSAEAETLLMFASRAVHLDNLVRPALLRGEWVICDRFTDATRAYQGAGRGVDKYFIESLAAVVHSDLQPDLTLLLDLPVELGLARARTRRVSQGEVMPDRFESENLEFFSRVRNAYLEICDPSTGHYIVLDASQSQDQVAMAANRALNSLESNGQ